ncbi:pilus assembly protein TadE [Williamsia sp. CHRR-6]|nr:pilus assembly protein TadE [Williamsia sp. CHRR-6]
MVTVEAAFAIAAIVAVLVLGVGSVLAVGTHIRCIDAAREAARIAAQGDSAGASNAGRSVAPAGAGVDISVRGDRAVVSVRASSPMLPGVDLGATATAVIEPVAQQSP